MRRIVMALGNGGQRLVELRVIGNRKGDGQEIGAFDFEAVLDSDCNRTIVIVQTALRSRMGCFIASCTIRSITSPWDSFARRAAIANSAPLSSHGFGFTSIT